MRLRFVKIVRAVSIAASVTLTFAALGAPLSCGGDKKKDAQAPEVIDLDKDPLALLPASPVSVMAVDLRGLADDEVLGKSLAKLSDRWIPASFGIVPSRDFDRAVVASYATQGIDALGVVSGRFDETKIKSAVDSGGTVRPGSAVVQSSYGGRTVYTASNIGFTVLTPKTALVGSEQAMRRAIDKIQDKRVARTLPQWMLDVLEEKGVKLASATDFSTQAIASASVGPIQIPWVKAIQTTRVALTTQGPVELRGKASFADAESASAAAGQVRSFERLIKVFGPAFRVPRFEKFEIAANDKVVDFTFAMDKGAVSQWLETAPAWLPMQ